MYVPLLSPSSGRDQLLRGSGFFSVAYPTNSSIVSEHGNMSLRDYQLLYYHVLHFREAMKKYGECDKCEGSVGVCEECRGEFTI